MIVVFRLGGELLEDALVEDLLVGELEVLPVAHDVLLRLENRPLFHLK